MLKKPWTHALLKFSKITQKPKLILEKVSTKKYNLPTTLIVF